MELINRRLESGTEEDFDLVRAYLHEYLARECASVGKTIYYNDACEFIKKNFQIDIQPYSQILHNLLYEVSVREHNEGYPMLSVFVVNKETGRPGDVFFRLAKDLGRYKGSLKDEAAKEAFYIAEVNDAYAFWKNEYDEMWRQLSNDFTR